MRLKNKVAIITGGAGNIGKAIALAFSSEGAAVVVASRNLANLEAVTSEIKAMGGRAAAIKTDVANEEQVQKMVEQTLSEYGKIDILVNSILNVGPNANVVDIKLEDWNQTIAVNLTGPMLCSREALKNMLPRRSGNIINISSLSGKMGMVLRSTYCASKWGLNGFTQTLSMEVGKYNIRVNAIAPGPVIGEALDGSIKTMAEILGLPARDLVDKMISRASLGRFVTAEEVAQVAIFLSSDDSSGITGQVISIDAGRTSL